MSFSILENIFYNMSFEVFGAYLYIYLDGNLNSKISNYLKLKSVSGSITRAHGSHTTINAPTEDGYSFLCWLSARSSGWIGNLYIENIANQTSNVWSANYGYTDTGSGNFNATALYIKN